MQNHKKILIIGASSAIAQAVAREWAEKDVSFYLFARDPLKLTRVAEDLKARSGAAVEGSHFDFNCFERHREEIEQACRSLGQIDTVLIAHGSLPEESDSPLDWSSTLDSLKDNYLSTVSFLTHLTPYFEDWGSGSIVVISSVAGDRGKKSNYLYGSAKAGLSVYLQGLRHRMFSKGVNVVIVKPGFVDTPMTSGFQKGLLFSQPQTIAKGIAKAVRKRKGVVYLPFYWRCIMIAIKAIPDSIFNRLNL